VPREGLKEIDMIRTFTHRLSLASRLAASGLAALALVGAPAATAQDGSEEPAKEMTKGEAKLAELLEGRVAGEPQDCIRDFGRTHLKTIDETAYVYGRGRTIYVQHTRDPEGIDDSDVLVIQRYGGTQLCRLDLIKTIDRYSGFFTGGVQFDKFIPYTRVDEEAL
jgi:hypothetical protein